MPKLRAINTNRSRVTPVGVLQQGRVGKAPEAGALQPSHECIALNCGADLVSDDMPVPLCPKHLRLAYEYAQGLIEDRLIAAAVSTMT